MRNPKFLKDYFNTCILMPFIKHDEGDVWDWKVKAWVKKSPLEVESDERILYGDEFPETEEEERKMVERIAQKFKKMKQRLEEKRRKGV